MNNYVLALETSVKQGSICLLSDDQAVDSWICPENVSMSEHLLPEIDAILKRNVITLDDIKKIVVSTGPGSFTGIRVGISTARALAFSSGCELRGVSVFQAMACSSIPRGEILCITSAGRNEFFCQEFLRDGETIQNTSQIILPNASDNAVKINSKPFDEVIFEKSSYDNFIKNYPEFNVLGDNNQKIKITDQNIAKLIGQYGKDPKTAPGDEDNLSAIYGREVTIGR